MSRSYRKPYYTWCSGGSASYDKRIARRSVRATQNNALRNVADWDEFLVPDIYECKHNNVYDWNRDGKKILWQTPVLTWDIYRFVMRRYSTSTEEELIRHHIEMFEDDVRWYERLKRK